MWNIKFNLCSKHISSELTLSLSLTGGSLLETRIERKLSETSDKIVWQTISLEAELIFGEVTIG